MSKFKRFLAVLGVVMLPPTLSFVFTSKAQAAELSDFYIDACTGTNFTGTCVRLYVTESLSDLSSKGLYKNIRSLRLYNDTWVYLFSEKNFRGQSAWHGWRTGVQAPSIGTQVDIPDVNEGLWRDDSFPYVNWQDNAASMVVFVMGSDPSTNPTMSMMTEKTLIVAKQHNGAGEVVREKYLTVTDFYQYWGNDTEDKYIDYRIPYPVISAKSWDGSIPTQYALFSVSPANPELFFAMKALVGFDASGNPIKNFVCGDRLAKNEGLWRPLFARSFEWGPWESFIFTSKAPPPAGDTSYTFSSKFATLDHVEIVDKEVAGTDNYYPETLVDYENLHYAPPVIHYWYNKPPPTEPTFYFSYSGM